jgi:hypothetical protein
MGGERKRLDVRNLLKRFESSEPSGCFREAREFIQEQSGEYYKIDSGSIPSDGPGQIIFYAEVYRA